MSTNNQALVEVQRSLPIPQSRFDDFIVKTHTLAETAETECADALSHTVDTEAMFQLADTLMVSFKKKVKDIGDERLGLTRGIDDFKQVILDAEKLVSKVYENAIGELAERMSTFRRQKRLEVEAAQRAAESELAEQKAKLETEAAKLEDKASTLKTPAAKERAISEAESLRQTAALTPTSVALSASVPQTVASDIGDKWEWQSFPSLSDFLRWLADHPEWHTLVVNPKTGKPHFPVGEMNRMAKQFRDIVPVPGVKFHCVDSFRTKSR